MDDVINEYIDKSNRKIEIGSSSNSMVAECNGIEIGRFEFDIIDDEFEKRSAYMLTNCDINPNYQRSGIGLEMMKASEEYYGNFLIVNHFSTEGAGFLNYCTEHIFKYKHNTIEDNRY